MIVVTAPTGQIGAGVLKHLLRTDAYIRVVVRDASKLSNEARGRCEVVEGSHGDAAVVDRAFERADAVFWLAPPNPGATLEETYLDFTRPAAAAIARHRVGRVVGITALGRGTRWEREAGMVTMSIKMGDMFMATGVAMREVAMPSFMDNLLWQVDSIRDGGRISECIDADRKLPMTATRDIAAVAARLLADDAWTDQSEVPVLGPEDLSFNDMATIISDVLGRDVKYAQTSFDETRRQLMERGASTSFADGYVEMMRAKNEGMDNVAERHATSRSTTSFREWCETALKPAVEG